jgi:hypothetical protein
MSERRIDGFFHGPFMDVGILRNNGADPMNVRRAYVDDFALRIEYVNSVASAWRPPGGACTAL